MATVKPIRVFYRGGHPGRKGVLGVLAGPVDNPTEVESTLFYISTGDRWSHLEFPFAVSWVTYWARPGTKDEAWWLVGKRGEVAEYAGGAPRVERIETAGTGPLDRKFGYLCKIRVIDETLFICGYRRQVYQLKGNRWDLISDPILDRRAKGPWNGFEAIDGFSKDDLYAAGDDGEIWHFDGKTWAECDSPTNQHLADLRCLDGKVWICGDSGIILRGDKDGWEVTWDDEDPSENWWNLERFQGRMYFAGNDCLAALENDKVVPIDVGIKDYITTMVLHAKDGILWSIGEKDILAFDGKAWRELVVPENR